jgi:hypothetical protein
MESLEDEVGEEGIEVGEDEFPYNVEHSEYSEEEEIKGESLTELIRKDIEFCNLEKRESSSSEDESLNLKEKFEKFLKLKVDSSTFRIIEQAKENYKKTKGKEIVIPTIFSKNRDVILKLIEWYKLP